MAGRRPYGYLGRVGTFAMTSTKLLFAPLLLATTLVGCGNGDVDGQGGSGTAGAGGGGGVPWEPDGTWGVAQPIETAARVCGSRHCDDADR